MTAVKTTRVSVSNTWDRVAVIAKFPTGGSVAFSITRNGERLAVAGANDQKESREQLAVIKVFCETFPQDKNHGERVQRIAAELRKHTSVGSLVAALKASK